MFVDCLLIDDIIIFLGWNFISEYFCDIYNFIKYFERELKLNQL